MAPTPALAFGLILAGGQGRRLGGADKALLPFGGQSLLAQAIARLTPQVRQIALSANGDPVRFASFGLTVLPDPPAWPGAGPLAGIVAGLSWAEKLWSDAAKDGIALPGLLTLAIDTPFSPFDLGARLATAARQAPQGAAIAAYQGRLHPTCAFWPLSARPALEKALSQGQRRLVDICGKLQAAPVDFADYPEDPFENINTREALAQAEARLKATRSAPIQKPR